MDPNSRNQRWSAWVFDIREYGRHVPKNTVEYNAARYFRAGFGSVSQFRVRQRPTGWRLELRTEGSPAHDPAYVESVRKDFALKFLAAGWGGLASFKMSVKILAGHSDDGRPALQWIGLPMITVEQS